MLYIMSYKYPVSEYIFSTLTSKDVSIITIDRNIILSKETVSKLKAIKKSDVVLLWDIVGLIHALKIAVMVKASRKYLWIWNTLGENYRSWRIKILKKYYQIFTFDKNDAKKYDLNYKEQVYCLKPTEKHEEVKYDFYFVGFNKNRGNIIEYLKNILGQEYICKFIIYQEGHFSDFDYLENLLNVLNSKCLVDIVKDEQIGYTIRVLESVFYNKKLITNNKDIINSDLYNENNIFVLGYDKIEDIDDFMKKTIVPISDDILKRYDINVWIRNFI